MRITFRCDPALIDHLPRPVPAKAVLPVNRDHLPLRLFTGLVDADRFNDVGINFPTVWTDAGFSGVLPRGTPVAQCFAVSR